MNKFLDYFDEVYVVSLNDRPERRILIKNELDGFNIPFTWFDAIRDENGIKGLLLSMKKLFHEILDKGQQMVIIMEDDCAFLLNAKLFLKEVLPQFPTSYHLMYLGLNLLTQPLRLSDNILKVRQAYSTHAIIYTREAIELILPIIDTDNPVPYDILLMKNIQGLEQSYCTFPMLATQRKGFSDIERKEIDWGKLMATTFAMHTKRLRKMGEMGQPCVNEHTWDWAVPSINPEQHQWQHIDLRQRPCDCKRFLYWEQLCLCGVPKWEIKLMENSNV